MWCVLWSIGLSVKIRSNNNLKNLIYISKYWIGSSNFDLDKYLYINTTHTLNGFTNCVFIVTLKPGSFIMENSVERQAYLNIGYVQFIYLYNLFFIR